MAALALTATTACAHRPPMTAQPMASACHRVAPDPSRAVAWTAPGEPRDLERLDDWCRTVGPVLVESPEGAAATTTGIDRLAVVTWNVHVGGGDVEELIARLRRGEFTGGAAVRDFVLLLQEAHREGLDVPARVPGGAALPDPIVERLPGGGRRDVRTDARAAGLHLFYAPGMRNSAADAIVPEDRGTAILSTLALADLQAIELPFERQRRVALAATVTSETAAGRPWQLRLANVQIDTALALTRGGPFAARKRQAEGVVEALSGLTSIARQPMVLGGDFNTWLGDREPALEVLRAAFPDTPDGRYGSTWRGPLGAHASLDYVFVRGPVRSVATRRLPDRYGSDHYPLLTVVEF
jgi:endonuclease/exonuclease/phosphatase family metal-dependent hydrolase